MPPYSNTLQLDYDDDLVVVHSVDNNRVHERHDNKKLRRNKDRKVSPNYSNKTTIKTRPDVCNSPKPLKAKMQCKQRKPQSMKQQRSPKSMKQQRKPQSMKQQRKPQNMKQQHEAQQPQQRFRTSGTSVQSSNGKQLRKSGVSGQSPNAKQLRSSGTSGQSSNGKQPRTSGSSVQSSNGKQLRTSGKQRRSNMTRKRVSFGNVEVRQYARCLGDNPSTFPDGPSLSLDWKYRKCVKIPLNQFEKQRRGLRRESEGDLLLGGEERERILKEHTDCTDEEIEDNIKELKRILRQQTQSMWTKPFNSFQRVFEKTRHQSSKLKAILSIKK